MIGKLEILQRLKKTEDGTNLIYLGLYYLRKAGINNQDAWDILQKTYAKCYDIKQKEDRMTSTAYFLMALKNMQKNYYRDKKHYQDNFVSFDSMDRREQVDNRRPEDEIMMREMWENIVNEINQVKNETHREVLELYYIEDKDYLEISEELQVNYDNVRKIVSRFKHHLIIVLGE